MINDISLYISYWLYHILHYDTLSSMHMRINKPVLHRFKKNMFLAENFRITGGKQMVHTECSYIYFIFIFSEVNLLFKWFITTTWKHLVLINDGILFIPMHDLHLSFWFFTWIYEVRTYPNPEYWILWIYLTLEVKLLLNSLKVLQMSMHGLHMQCKLTQYHSSYIFIVWYLGFVDDLYYCLY